MCIHTPASSLSGFSIVRFERKKRKKERKGKRDAVSKRTKEYSLN